MKTSETQNWEQVRAKGRASFILRVGILRRGVPLALPFALGWSLLAFYHHYLDGSEAVCIAAMTAVLALSIGLLSGIRSWQKQEQQYVSEIDHVA
jgi:nitroimidazol reductase NimA-like FMN-containing flavoprotein (pyridoxamine 5'-phosphate oxidase superfamily)